MNDKVLSVKIYHIREINNIQINMPVRPDVYAISTQRKISKR